MASANNIQGNSTREKQAHKKISKASIYRATASSSAIETGISTDELEKKLKAQHSPFFALTLAQ